MNNKLIREELKRMSNLMGYDTSKTLTEQKKLVKTVVDDIVTSLTTAFRGEPASWRVVVQTEDGRQYMDVVKAFADVGETAPINLVKLEGLVNGNSWKSFKTGFDSLEEFVDSILTGSMTGGHKKSLLKIFLSNTEDVAKNAGDILGDKTVKKALLDEINITESPPIDDISDFLFDVPFKDLDLPGHKELVKSLNRQLSDVLKKMNATPSATGKAFKSVLGSVFSMQGAKYFLWVMMGGYTFDAIRGIWKDDTDDPIKESTSQKVKDAFSPVYWIEMKKNMSDIDQNKNLMSPPELGEAYTEMVTQLDNWNNDPDATTKIYGETSKIKTIIQASQFTQHYNTNTLGGDLVADIAESMGIAMMKGTLNQILLDLFGDETFLKVFKQIENLDICLGGNCKEAVTTEEVLKISYSNSPEYPRYQYDNNDVLWCSIFVPGQLIPTTVIQDYSEWCVANNGCGGMKKKLAWVDRFQYIPVTVLNKKHRDRTDSDMFKIATQEDSYGDPICDGSLAKNTIDFDKGQFKAIIEDALEKSKKEDE